MKRGLLTGRCVDAVCIDQAFLIISYIKNLVACLGSVRSWIKITGQLQLLIGVIRDQPVRPPILESSNKIMVVVDNRVPDLEQHDWLYHHSVSGKWPEQSREYRIKEELKKFWPWSLWSSRWASWSLCCFCTPAETTEGHSALKSSHCKQE